MSRLDSILRDHPEVGDVDITYEPDFGLEPGDKFTTSEYPCRSLNCVCGEGVLFVLIPYYPFVFGYRRGLPLDLAFVPGEYEFLSGVLPIYGRCALAATEHLSIRCPSCRKKTLVQRARDGGLLLESNLTKIQRTIPTARLHVLRNPKKEWQ